MSESAPGNRSRRIRWILICFGLVGGYLGFSLLNYNPNYMGLKYVLETLPLGWCAFLERAFPRVSIDVSAVSLGCLSLILVATLIHRCGCANSSRWTWRSTTAATAAPGLLFIIVLSAGGIQKNVKELAAERRLVISESVMSRYEWQEIEERLKKQERPVPPNQ